MSAITGVCHWDQQPVASTVTATLAAQTRVFGTRTGRVSPQPWLVLQAQGLVFDRLSAVERQPVTFGGGSVLTWDGRLDNRDDLLVRLARTDKTYGEAPSERMDRVHAEEFDSLKHCLGPVAHWELVARGYVVPDVVAAALAMPDTGRPRTAHFLKTCIDLEMWLRAVTVRTPAAPAPAAVDREPARAAAGSLPLPARSRA